ncbi:MAG: hypothetical protein BroJett011_08470 [Chloroflexota bacterium]|nr:MAG: hypothetical protein BroJett011_08470 [Chloroflexota bacterium]
MDFGLGALGFSSHRTGTYMVIVMGRGNAARKVNTIINPAESQTSQRCRRNACGEQTPLAQSAWA